MLQSSRVRLTAFMAAILISTPLFSAGKRSRDEGASTAGDKISNSERQILKSALRKLELEGEPHEPCEDAYQKGAYQDDDYEFDFSDKKNGDALRKIDYDSEEEGDRLLTPPRRRQRTSLMYALGARSISYGDRGLLKKVMTQSARKRIAGAESKRPADRLALLNLAHPEDQRAAARWSREYVLSGQAENQVFCDQLIREEGDLQDETLPDDSITMEARITWHQQKACKLLRPLVASGDCEATILFAETLLDYWRFRSERDRVLTDDEITAREGIDDIECCDRSSAHQKYALELLTPYLEISDLSVTQAIADRCWLFGVLGESDYRIYSDADIARIGNPDELDARAWHRSYALSLIEQGLCQTSEMEIIRAEWAWEYAVSGDEQYRVFPGSDQEKHRDYALKMLEKLAHNGSTRAARALAQFCKDFSETGDEAHLVYSGCSQDEHYAYALELLNIDEHQEDYELLALLDAWGIERNQG